MRGRKALGWRIVTVLVVILLAMTVATLADTTTQFNANNDSYIREDSAYSTDGNNSRVYVRSYRDCFLWWCTNYNRRAYVGFNQSVPANATIISAQLRLFMDTSPGNRTYEAYRVTSSWSEGSVSWSNRPSQSSTHTASISTGTSTGWKTWDVTGDVQNWYNNPAANPLYGWMIQDANENSGSDVYARFRSSEYSGSTYDPQLIIVYNRPPNAPTQSAPADGVFTSDNTPTLTSGTTTDPDGDGLSYDISINGVWHDAAGSPPQYTPTSALPEGTHTWRVRACDGRVCTESATDWSFTVDTDTPPAPAYLYEGNPDQDYFSSNSYSMNINWGAVSGSQYESGIFYDLQRRVHNGTSWSGWSTIYSGGNTSFTDTGSYNDNYRLQYQVSARTGAGFSSGWQPSDSILIDSETPAQVTGVAEGDVVGTDDAWDQDNTFYVYWNNVAETGSGISYKVQRSINGGGWEDVDFETGTEGSDAIHHWGDDDAGISEGDTVTYRVKAVNGAGLEGPWSDTSSGIRIDLTAPDSTVDTTGVYSPLSWPDHIEGDANDGGSSGVDFVDLRIYDSDADAYWNGTDWNGDASSWLRATNNSWVYPLLSANLTDGHTYLVDSRATDVAGNIETSYGTNNFTYADRAPETPVVTSTTHLNPGTWYNDPQPSFSWNEPYSAIGVAGYSILLDQYSSTIPDKIQDTNQLTYDAATTPDGVWYFHVRAVDTSGQWGGAGHVQVNIDTAMPQAPASVTEGSPDVNFDADGDMVVHWSAVPNTGSGISYRLERQVTPFGGSAGAWTLVTGADALTDTTSFNDTSHPVYGDGDSVRYQVRATNGVGLTGNWTASDGMVIDSEPVEQPDWVYDNNPDINYHNAGNGAVTVYWDTVADTGSNITYRLEKQVNTTPWQLVAEGLTGNNRPDSGSYSDDDTVRYRVTAVNGVGTESLARASDGFVIDLGIPALPGYVYEGSDTVDWDYDDDGSLSVYWAAVADTGSEITYRLEKSVDDGVWQEVAANIAAANQADTNPGIADGARIRYRVTPVNGAGTEGPYRLSDGIIIDLDTPQSTGWVRENDPDVDFDTDGAVWVNWASVPNTGSGIVYDLQKQINGTGWTDLVTGLTSTSFNDTQTLGDDTFIEYQVTVRNGVGRASAPTPSDGVRVDTDTPATPTNVGEGDAVGTDDLFDQDNTFYVYWTGVPATATGDLIRYTVERNVNGSGWNTAVTGLTVDSWDDPQAYSNGDQVAYRVIAVNGAGSAGSASVASDGITIDTGRPDTEISTSGYYNAVSWPDQIEGTASDDYSEVAQVEITIFDNNANQWWDGSGWQTSATPIWITITGSVANWIYNLPDSHLTDGHLYNLQSRAIDNAGNVETTLGVSSFIFASSGPEAPVVSSSSHPIQTNWYNDNDPAFTWTIPGGTAPVTGYSYVLDQNPGTTPDTTVETTGTSAAFINTGNGTWFFHVRALDSTGNWGPAGHYQINIDTTTPAAPAVVTDDSPDVDWDFDGGINVYWSGVPDTGSGIVYIVERELDNSGVWTQLTTTEPGTVYLDPSPATPYPNGTIVRYRVSARNGVNLTGPTALSDGFTVDNAAPSAPTWITENAPAPNDEEFDPDGSVQVFWASSTGTSSGLSYRLERQITVGGVPNGWVQIAAGLTGTSYTDPVTHNDGEFVEYRITAVNGVGSSSAAVTSNGITIDTDTPAAPTEVTENSPDVDWSVDGAVTVFWSGVADTGSGVTYRLEKQIGTGNWTLVTGADNLPGDTTSYADSGTYNDEDTVRYRVRATNNAGTAGAWRESDGMVIDSSLVAAPAWVREENPDIDFDADGTVTVYWAAVTNTGSGITYQLEKQIGTGGSWNTIAQGLVGTSYYDGQNQPDGTEIHYQVTAINGVNTAGTPTASDGLTVDTEHPATPAGLGEGDTAGADDMFDQDNAFFVFWDTVASTGSGITYDLEKSLNGGSWETAATGISGTSWDDPVPYSNGDTILYRVRAVSGAGVQGAWSGSSSGITLDFVQPDSAVTTNGYYNQFDWPGMIRGTAGDSGSDVAQVQITLSRASDGQFWNGSGWQSASLLLDTVGTINWQYSFAPTDGETYDIRAYATDNAANAETTPGVGSFTYASSGPQAPEISSGTHANETIWYNDSNPVFSWTVPSSVAPVTGYSYVLDQNPGTTPDPVPDTSGLNTSFTNLTDGIWYFHVRAVDNTSNWGPADHFAVHIDTAFPATPASITEDQPDIDFDADGTFTVYWTAVPDTGSGITYHLERRIGSSAWQEIATTVATSFADSGSYADDTTLTYRVSAENGVAHTGNSATSDGIIIDSDVPNAPAWVREGVDTDPDWAWDADGAYTVYWAGVTNTGSGITYQLERRIDSGAWQIIATTVNRNYDDSGTYPNGTLIEYRVTAINGAGLASNPDLAVSNGIRIDNNTPGTPVSVTEGSPDFDVDFDVDGIYTVYWNAVTDTGSGITYRLERNLNSAGWAVLAPSLSVTTYDDDIGVGDGTTALYRVTAINGVGAEGTPRLSDGVTVDSQPVPQPGWVREDSATAPDRDYHTNADGAVAVYWAAVIDTGSGIRYRLEKRVNGAANPWTLVANNLVGTSYPDSGAYSDDDFIEYRVTAINGVLTESETRLSDGMRIDTDTPNAPSAVGEGDTAGIDDDFDQDNTYWVFWDAVPVTATGDTIRYTVERSRNGSSWEVAGFGLSCNNTPCRWEDPTPYSNGDTILYRVFATNSAGHAGIASTASDGITIDSAPPDSNVTTFGFYNAFNWPGYIQGIASDNLSDVAYVDITLQRRSDNQYWNGTGWGGTLTWLRVTSTLNWQYPLALATLTDGATYDVRSRATDNADNTESTVGTGSFTFAGAGPGAPTVSSTTHPVQTNWYNHNDPILVWTAPTSSVPVVGYSYLLDQIPATTPDTQADIPNTTVTYPDLPDGIWYFHVRAQDEAGNWGPAGHYRLNIDTDTPASPTTVTEESPDIDWDSDGDITVHWDAVTDTGSGITYQLEQDLGSGWTLVAGGLTATSYPVSGFANGDSAIFRVQATNGVGLNSGWTQSDGVSFDLTTPATPTNVGEGDVVGTDDDWDQDNNFYVFWTAAPDTPSGITYSIERSRNSGTWTLVASGVTTNFWEDDTAYSSGETVAYRVTAHTGAGHSSSVSAPSDGLTLDLVRPDSTVSTSGSYNLFTWPGQIDGTATDYNLSGVAYVDITIRRQVDNLYWDGSTWGTTPVWLGVTGTANWQYPFTPDDGHSYRVDSRATDNAGNIQLALGNSIFSYISSEVAIDLTDGRTTVQPGERITYTIAFSSPYTLYGGQVQVDVPAHTTYVNAIPTPDTTGSIILWQLGLLQSPVSEQRYMVVDLEPVMDNGTVISTTTLINSGSYQSWAWDNSVVVSNPDLSTSLVEVSNSDALPGEQVTYRIALTNTGNMHAHHVMLTDTLPAEMVYENDLTASSGAPSYVNGDVLWSGEIRVGTPVVITFTARVSDTVIPGTVIENKAVINDGFHTEALERSAWIAVAQPAPANGIIYLPLIMTGVEAAPPSEPGVELVIRNCGNVDAVGSFWVDLYFNPAHNTYWPISYGEGYDWFGQGAGFTVSMLGPGQSLALYLSDATLSNLPDPLPASAELYAQVDWFGSDANGVVNEGPGGEQNNVADSNGAACEATSGYSDLIVESIRIIRAAEQAVEPAEVSTTSEGVVPAPDRPQPPQP